MQARSLIISIVVTSCLAVAPAAAGCLDGKAAHGAGDLGQAIALGEDALTRAACREPLKRPLVLSNLAYALADRAGATGGVADHCDAARRFRQVVRSVADAGDRFESLLAPYAVDAGPKAEIQQLACDVGGRLQEGDRAGAIARLDVFVDAHAASPDPALADAARAAAERRSALREGFGGVIADCLPGDAFTVEGMPGSAPCPGRWGAVPVGEWTIVASRAGEVPIPMTIRVPADRDVRVPLGQVTVAIRAAQRGAALRDAGRCAEALDAFHEAEAGFTALGDHGEDAGAQRYEAARCLEALDRPVEALAAYDASLSMSLPASLRPEVSARRAALRGRAFGQVEVECAASGAELVLDARPTVINRCGGRWQDVPVGQHTVRLRAAGSPDRGESFDVRPGQTTRVAFAPERSDVLAWSLTAAMAVSLTTGAIFYGLATDASSDGLAAQSRYWSVPTPAEAEVEERAARAAMDRAEDRAGIAYVALGLGVALAASTVWAWQIDAEAGDAGSTGARVMVAPASGALRWSW